MMILVLALNSLNIRYTNWMLFAWAGFFVIAAIAKLLVKREYVESLKQEISSLNWWDGLIAFGFIFLLLIRVSQTDQLYVPSWMDSIFHANIVQGFLEQGQIPANLNYHFGYHLLTFINCELFDWNIPASMLMTGQWLNSLLSLALFYFIERKFSNRLLSVFSVLLFSLFAVFPAYLVNWSRFSILLGTAFALIITGRLFQDEQKWSLSLILSTSILLLAQVLTHYTSVVLTGFIVLVLAYPILKQLRIKKLIKDFKKNVSIGVVLGASFALLAIGSFVITRIINMAQGGEFANILSSTRNLTEQFSFQYFWYLASDISGWFFLIIGTAGILLMLFIGKKLKENHYFQTTCLWFLLMVLFVAIQTAILGGSQPSLTNVFIWSFIPLAISGGLFLSQLLEWFNHIFPHYKPYATPVLITLFVLVGCFISPIFINPLTVMYSDADQQAMQWMVENLTAEDWILINAQPFEDRLQPADGGGWIPYLTDLNITYPNPDEQKDFTDWFSSINIDYIYQGNQGVVYDLTTLEEEYSFTPVFQMDEVVIYQVSLR